MGVKAILQHNTSFINMYNSSLTKKNGAKWIICFWSQSLSGKTGSKRPYSAISNDILPPETDENITEYILKAIISLNLSFRAIDNPALVDLLRLLDPKISFPRRTKLRSLLNTRFETVKQKLLAGKPRHTAISIALDTWTSPNHLALLGIVGSFINSRRERKEIPLGFEPLPRAYVNTKKGPSRTLTNWNINLLLDTVQVHHHFPGLQPVDGSVNPLASQ